MSAAPTADRLVALCAACGRTSRVRWRSGRYELTRHYCGARQRVDAASMIAAWATAEGDRARRVLAVVEAAPISDVQAEAVRIAREGVGRYDSIRARVLGGGPVVSDGRWKRATWATRPTLWLTVRERLDGDVDVRTWLDEVGDWSEVEQCPAAYWRAEGRVIASDRFRGVTAASVEAA